VDSEFQYRYRAVEARDARFDGWFLTGVLTTGIFCRPSCPARTPRPENVRFFPTALSARRAGLRACKRCRPEAVPGGVGWDTGRDVAARAMDLIAQGLVDERGVPGLASELGFSERHLHRLLVRTVGAAPLTLARAMRVKRATLLLETTDLPIAEVASAAGFTSLRQFNVCVRDACGYTPREVRARRSLRSSAGADSIQLRLPYRAPHDVAALVRFLAARAIPGVEEVRGERYIRSLRLPHGAGLMRLEPRAGAVHAHFALEDMRDLAVAVGGCRHLLDLESDPRPILARLIDDSLIGNLVRASPGRRVPGTVDSHELAVRAVLGQQVTLGAAAKLAAALVSAYGEPLRQPNGRITHLFPTAERIADGELIELAMPGARREALRRLAGSLATHPLESRGAGDGLAGRLLSLQGIGPWTAGYIAMRALRDPDAFLPSDAGVRRAMGLLGFHANSRPRELERLAERWRPYRAYAVQHLWALDAERPRRHDERLAA
jgi:AraC family transcriptional regulator, regulatory protein of adaptative response / DNA-3-methyladenine glycosylase II